MGVVDSSSSSHKPHLRLVTEADPTPTPQAKTDLERYYDTTQVASALLVRHFTRLPPEQQTALRPALTEVHRSLQELGVRVLHQALEQGALQWTS